MRNFLLKLSFSLFTVAAFSQAGHIMQGVGSVNMSMGGAATGQPLDISGALHWNPASISAFEENEVRFDLGLFFSSPELSSTVPEFDSMGMPTGNFFSGTTKDDRGVSPLPNLAFVWASADSRHSFGASAFGISGFGVTFPESSSNPINFPQNLGGFGRIESAYSLLQTSFTYAYELSDKFSVGIQPNFDYATLELMPNPTANPSPTAGYPSTDKATAFGFGGQIGLFYDSGSGFKAGTSYKTTQSFGEFELDNTYLDSSTGTNKLALDYPAIFSADYRWVNYENTDGFSKTGWTPTFSVAGFGWKDIDIISAGIQYKGIDRLPLRVGYTYSSNPISSETAFFNTPATAIIKNAFQFGLGYDINDRWGIDGVFHYGSSGNATAGPIYNPQFIGSFPPYGAIPGSEVSYDMTTSMVMIGVSYKLKAKATN
jgi:long-chain fatty acid transport protein